MIKTISLLFLLSYITIAGEITTRQNKQQVSFEKIIFHTTACNGACAVYHLQVEADKTLKLFAESVYKTEKGFPSGQDTTKTGYFTGAVNDTSFVLLNKELDSIGLDSLEFNDAQCCDGSIITIIVYYNGKRKFLRSMFPPAKARKLIAILYDISCKSNLTRTANKFDIEEVR